MTRDLLRRYPLFNLFPDSWLDSWLALGRDVGYQTGETIFSEGSAGTWAYLVLDGEVRILRATEEGRDSTLGRAQPGELFGEYALLAPHRNTATCRATRPTRLLRLPLPPLRQLLQARPRVRVNLKNWLRLHTLCSYLRDRAYLGFLSAASSLAFHDFLQPLTFEALCTMLADGLGTDRWYFIESGQVLLSPVGGKEGEPPRELDAGDCFGENALLGRPPHFMATALTETRCLCLMEAQFDPSAGMRTQQSLQSYLGAGPATGYPWVGQEEEADCGLAALAMVARCHGRDETLQSLRSQVQIGAQGLSLLDLQRLADGLGLPCQAVRISLTRLGDVQLPALFHFRDGHFVVVYEANPIEAVVGDPASGVVRLSLELLCRSCSGYALLFPYHRPVSG